MFINSYIYDGFLELNVTIATFIMEYIGTTTKAPIGPKMAAEATTKKMSVIGWIFMALDITRGTITLPLMA